MQDLLNTIQSMQWSDGLDIALVAIFFYVIFSLLRETRSFVALMGFVVVIISSLLLFLVARTNNLKAMTLIFTHFWILGVLLFLIVFQNDFKKALTAIGQSRLFRAFLPRQTRYVDEVIRAATTLAKRKVGALIAFERRNPLKAYQTHGTTVDAEISSELIRTIFSPYTPLHDGALIIIGDRISAAACVLPTSDNPQLSRDLGTRHRAALGLSEETDAVVVVVSEETGQISLMIEGKLERNITPETLQHRLEKELDIVKEEGTQEAPHGNA